ncbi:interferon-stimulated 20 kDa exonuclease-like 2 [Rhinophrynus dorsalis]
MSDMLLNLDVGPSESRERAEHYNQKHQRFIKKRRFLERKGFLKEKQLPARRNNVPSNNSGPQTNSWDHGKKRGNQDHTWNTFNRTKRPYHETSFRNGYQQHEAPTKRSGTAPPGKPIQSGTLTVSVGSSPHNSRLAIYTPKEEPFRGQRSSAPINGRVFSTRTHTQPFPTHHQTSLLSEYESGLPPVAPEGKQPYKMVAIDCEMVGTGPKGCNSDLARCSIVNYYGDTVYDKYIQPSNPVTDYRTRWSGIRREHLINATPFRIAQKEILKILSGKIVVGHAIHNDFKAINYFHPKEMTRDTSKIPLLNRKAGFQETEVASLKRLAKQLLHKDIQTGKRGHSSVEDAKTTMELYRVVEVEWERELAGGRVQQ